MWVCVFHNEVRAFHQGGNAGISLFSLFSSCLFSKFGGDSCVECCPIRALFSVPLVFSSDFYALMMVFFVIMGMLFLDDVDLFGK